MMQSHRHDDDGYMQSLDDYAVIDDVVTVSAVSNDSAADDDYMVVVLFIGTGK